MKRLHFVTFAALCLAAFFAGSVWKERSELKDMRFGKLIFIPGPGRGRYPFCNSIYIDDSKKGVIDPGSDEDRLKGLRDQGGVDRVIHSHYHEDHIAFNFLFPDADLCVHESEAPCYRSIRSLLDYYGLLGTEYEKAWHDIILQRFHYQERTPGLEFRDGDVLDFGSTKMEVIHTPGHSIGHCSFYFPREGVLYLGDLDMTHFGPWYGDRVSDIDDTIRSVQRLMEIPARIFVSAHEAGIMEGDFHDRAEEYLRVIDKRENKLVEYLKEPRTLEEIADQWLIYQRPREPKYLFEFAERALIRKHLERLERNRRLKMKGGRYFLI
jgi:hydroxyacylglutathione hydrolase